MDSILQEYLNALKIDSRKIVFRTTYEQLHSHFGEYYDEEIYTYALKPKSISDYIVQCYIVNSYFSPVEKESSNDYKINRKSDIVIQLISNRDR